MKKKLPRLASDKSAEKFVEATDLTQYDLSSLMHTRFEFAAKDARINMRLPDELLVAVKSEAARQRIPYQRFIRQTLESAVGARKAR